MVVYHHKNPAKIDSVQQVLYERRVLMFVSAINIVGVIVWLTAVATDYWIVVFPIKLSSYSEGKITRLWSHSGLWRKCDYFGFPSNNDPLALDGVVTESNCEVGADDAIFTAEVTGKTKKETHRFHDTNQVVYYGTAIQALQRTTTGHL